MEKIITVGLEVRDAETLADVVTLLKLMLCYMADNVIVTSSPPARDNVLRACEYEADRTDQAFTDDPGREPATEADYAVDIIRYLSRSYLSEDDSIRVALGE